MSSNWKRYAIGVLLICLSLVVAGCGSSKSDSVAAPAATTTTLSSPAGPSGSMGKALVSVYKMNADGTPDYSSPLGSTTSAADGSYTLNMTIYDGPIVIETTATADTESVPKIVTKKIGAGVTWRVAIFDRRKLAKIPMATPFTTMAAKQIKTYYDAAKLEKDAAAAAGRTMELPSLERLIISATTAVENTIAKMLGIASFDILGGDTTNAVNAFKMFDQILTNNATLDSATLISSFTSSINGDTTVLETVKGYITAAATSLGSGPAPIIIVPVAITVITTPVFEDTTAPSAPADLIGTKAAYTEVDLAWTASTDNKAVAGYTIVRDGIDIGTSSVPSFADTTVAAGKTYVYAVKAFDASGNISAASSSLSVTTPAAPDASYLNITASGQVKTQ